MSGKDMSDRRIYFDYNATAPLRRGARVAMTSALHLHGNASSVHQEGRSQRKLVEHARQSIARLVQAKPAEIVFTSGGTEANNWVIGAGWDIIFTAGVEHESILAPVDASGAKVVAIPVDANGIVDLLALKELFVGHCSPNSVNGKDLSRCRALLSLQMANNETGVVQPVAEAAALAKAHGIFVHTDSVQAVGRMPLVFSQAPEGSATAGLGADFMTVSSHKLGGPQGIGALLIREELELTPFMRGGGQERRRRAGTENVAAIAGFGSAANAAVRELATIGRLKDLRDKLEQGILAAPGKAIVIAAQAPRLANTSCVAFPGLAAETLVIKLDLQGFAVSAGSACSSGKVGASHVLAAMGLDMELARSAIRISLGWGSTEDDVDAFLQDWQAIAAARERAQVPA